MSDCANFVNIATSQTHDYNDMGALDNSNLWFCFIEVLRGRIDSVLLSKYDLFEFFEGGLEKGLLKLN